MKKKIVLDTNFLLVPYQFGIDIFGKIELVMEQPFELVVPSGVVSELEGLSRGRGKEGAAARFALKLLGLNKHTLLESRGNVDDWIVGYATGEGAIVATNDRPLRERLKKRHVKVISLRSRSVLGVV